MFEGDLNMIPEIEGSVRTWYNEQVDVHRIVCRRYE